MRNGSHLAFSHAEDCMGTHKFWFESKAENLYVIFRLERILGYYDRTVDTDDEDTDVESDDDDGDAEPRNHASTQTTDNNNMTSIMASIKASMADMWCCVQR